MRDEQVIRVQSHWNTWQTAEIRMDDLEDIHWFRPHGAPQHLLHGYVWCASIVDGDIPHKCSPFDAPHRLHVCVLKKHIVPSAYLELVRRGYVEIARRTESDQSRRRETDQFGHTESDQYRTKRTRAASR